MGKGKGTRKKLLLTMAGRGAGPGGTGIAGAAPPPGAGPPAAGPPAGPHPVGRGNAGGPVGMCPAFIILWGRLLLWIMR